MNMQHQPADERNTARAAEICELALAALVTDIGVPHADAAAILIREASRHLTPGTVPNALRKAS
jgi:hypothetical protein